ncbi:MAG: hypothetical protein Q4C60_11030 [Eubacteriales bacterium]|nr:hypothetical protein [Eubacteriales bacterium]
MGTNGESENREWTAEEAAANQAARQLQERKLRKRRRIRIAAIVCVLALAGGGFGLYRYRQYAQAKAEEEANVLALEDGETLIYGEITQVAGNEITIDVVEVSEQSQEENGMAPQGADESQSSDGAGEPQPREGAGESQPPETDGAASEGAGESQPPETDETAQEETEASGEVVVMAAGMGGGMPGGDFDFSSMGDMPSGGGDMPDFSSGEMPEGAGEGDMPDLPMTPQVQYTATGETREYQIPVGTEVTTQLGATTTFAKLSVGDIIGIVLEEGTDNILRIKIVE